MTTRRHPIKPSTSPHWGDVQLDTAVRVPDVFSCTAEDIARALTARNAERLAVLAGKTPDEQYAFVQQQHPRDRAEWLMLLDQETRP